MNHSTAISPFTMPAALAAADPLLGTPVWSGNPSNRKQAAWLETFRRRAAISATIPEIRSHATAQASDHEAWLQAQGWPAQITQGAPGDLFLAAAFDVAASWRAPGRAYQEDGVDRAILSVGASAAPGSGHPIVGVATQRGDFTFFFQQVSVAPVDPEELAEVSDRMASGRSSYEEEVHLDFPMVDLPVRGDAGYMIGLRAGDRVVTQAAEQLRLQLDETGGRASAAAEVAVSRNLGPRTIQIDGPFVVAVRRTAGDRVVFAAYCHRDCWRRPAAGRI